MWVEMDPRARRVAQQIVHAVWLQALLPIIVRTQTSGDARADLPAELLLSDAERTFRLMEWAPFLPDADPCFDLTKRGPDEIRAMAHAEVESLRRAWRPLWG